MLLDIWNICIEIQFQFRESSYIYAYILDPQVCNKCMIIKGMNSRRAFLIYWMMCEKCMVSREKSKGLFNISVENSKIAFIIKEIIRYYFERDIRNRKRNVKYALTFIIKRQFFLCRKLLMIYFHFKMKIAKFLESAIGNIMTLLVIQIT